MSCPYIPKKIVVLNIKIDTLLKLVMPHCIIRLFFITIRLMLLMLVFILLIGYNQFIHIPLPLLKYYLAKT